MVSYSGASVSHRGLSLILLFVASYWYATAKFAFPGIYDIESVALLLVFLDGFPYLVTTGWIFEISLREKFINQSTNMPLWPPGR